MPRPPATPEQIQEVRSLWGTLGRKDLARTVGLTIDQVVQIKMNYSLPSMQGRGGGRPSHANRERDPSPAEIKQRCKEVQQWWSDHERALRQGYPPLEQTERLGRIATESTTMRDDFSMFLLD